MFLQHNHYINAFSKLHSCLKETRWTWITDQRTKHTTVSRRKTWEWESALKMQYMYRCFCNVLWKIFSYHLSCHFKGFPHTAEDHGCERSSFIQWPQATWFSYLTKTSLFCLCNWNNAVFSISSSFLILCHLTATPEAAANHKLPLIQHGSTSVDISCFFLLKSCHYFFNLYSSLTLIARLCKYTSPIFSRFFL